MKMNTQQVIRLERNGRGYRILRNGLFVKYYTNRGYAFRIAKQIFDATKKLTTATVIFENEA